MSDYTEHYAFARGYFDGRQSGIPGNPFDPINEASPHEFYRVGYEFGLSDYRQLYPSGEVFA